MSNINAENIRKVINKLKAEEISFDMNYWSEDTAQPNCTGDKPQCGTVCCIGGHAESIMLTENNDPTILIFPTWQIGAWLGLNENRVDDLFFNYPRDFEVSRPAAIEVLENLIVTGEVDWDIIKPDSGVNVAD